MPPRIPIPTCMRASKSSPSPSFALPLRPFSSSPTSFARVAPKKRQANDPYSIALRNRKKSANLSRQAELKQQRSESLGDPVRGVTTPFVASFDKPSTLGGAGILKGINQFQRLNYGFTPEQVAQSLKRSKDLAIPKAESDENSPFSGKSQYDVQYGTEATSEAPKDTTQQVDKSHETATEAIRRITALDNGNSKIKTKINVARCVEMFGRHNTDRILPSKAPGLANVADPNSAPAQAETNVAAAIKRVGPDTGSSEVQIAILTAKIRTLAEFLQVRGKNDKVNKRNLRLLVHRRQKLLQYLRRKERGGPRWQHCIKSLGLTEGTWKGEISL